MRPPQRLAGELPPVVCLSFSRRDVPDGLKQSDVVEPAHPLQGGQFHGFPGLSGRSAVNQFGFVQPIDGLGQRVVVAVATTADRGFDASLGQALGVANGQVLGASVGMMNQGIGAGRLAVIQSLFQGIQHEVRTHGAVHAPAYDSPRKYVDDERHIQPTLPGRDIGEVRHP